MITYTRLPQVQLNYPGTNHNKPDNGSGYKKTIFEKNMQLTWFN